VEQALSVIAFGYCNDRDVRPEKALFDRAYASTDGQNRLRHRVTLLHCTSQYPAPYDSINLRAMDTLRAAFGLEVGLSDHSVGIAVPIAAVARGASVIEKHFTVNRQLPGPDHKASLEPSELKQMVDSIRQVEAAFGDGKKLPQTAELDTRCVAAKSLVAAADIEIGEMFSPDNVTVKRPGDGLQPIQFWSVLGKPARKNFQKDEFITI
jgi:sialic acid synthase SpsE